MAYMAAEVLTAKLALLVILSLILLYFIGTGLLYMNNFIRGLWETYWYGKRKHSNRLEQCQNSWPQQSAAGIDLPASNSHASSKQSRKLHWRAKVLERLSRRRAGASGQAGCQDGDQPPDYYDIQPPRPVATTNSHQDVDYMV